MLKRIPWAPLLVSLAVVLSSAFSVQPVWDAATRAEITDAYLTRPLGYVALAPLSNVLDMLTLLSARQHIAVLVSVLVLFTIWRVLLVWRSAPTIRAHVISTAFLVLAIIVTYAATLLLPRPMAALVSDNADIIRIDFHSHTAASHDGRAGWSAEDNRAWHRDGGYDVAYITDHAAVAAAEQGMARNPVPAADGVTILQGIEVTWTGEHVVILGAQRQYRGILTTNLRDVDVQALQLASLIPGREPVVIWNHPHRLGRLPTAQGPSTSGVRGIEISNGAPDSMDEVRRERAAIAAAAQQGNLTMTAGSDSHGWGRAAPNWTLMLIYGWRGLAGDALATQIETAIRKGGIGATRVVERRAAEATSGITLASTVAAAPARMLTTLSTDERVSWLIWTWAIAVAAWWFRRRRAAMPR